MPAYDGNRRYYVDLGVRRALPDVVRLRVDTGLFATAARDPHTTVVLTWGPGEKQMEDGLRVRIAGAAAEWARDNPDLRVPLAAGESDVMAGWHWRDGRFTTTLMGGVQFFSDGFGTHRRTGPAALAHLVWSPQDDVYVSAFVRATAPDRRVAVTVTTGWTTPYEFKIGPEAGVTFGPDGTALRAGLAVTGIPFFKAELNVSAGAKRHEDGRTGPYLAVWLTTRF